MKKWPQIGDEVTYKGTHLFWFVNIIHNAEKNLEIGKKYTIKTINILSSWCSITLVETNDLVYSLSFFDYEA